MTNDPYEELAPNSNFLDTSADELGAFGAALDSLDDSTPSTIEEENVPETTVEGSSQSTQPETPTTRIKGVATPEFLKQQYAEARAWKELPEGPEKQAAKDQWHLKYYGIKDPNFLQRYGVNKLRSDVDPATVGGVATAVGLLDTFTDTANLIPGVNIPKIPEFESQALQGFRHLSGLILPMRMLKGAVISKGAQIHKSKVAPQAVQRLGNDRLFRWFSEAGIDLGSGALVDYVAKQNQEDHNAAGIAKKAFPKFFQWIPYSIATQDLDSSDLKRTKNIREGAFLSWFGSLIEGITLISTAGKSVNRSTTRFIPKNELAKNNITNLKDEFSDIKFSDDPLLDQMARSQAREQKALDELGKYYLITEPSTTKPKLGAHDVFDANETSVRPKDVDGITGATVDAVRISENIESTYGRLASTITESARKFGLQADALSSRAVVMGLAEELKKAGKYSAELPSGKKISGEQIDHAGEQLAELLNDPRMQPGDMKLLLDEFKTSTTKGIRSLKNLGANAAIKSIENYKKEFFDMDVEKARAYFLTSEAGQASDIAEGARLMDGTTAVSRAQDQILDRLHYLMVETKLARYQNSLRREHLATLKQAMATGDTDLITKTVDEFLKNSDEKLADIIPSTETYISTLRGIKDEHPEFLRTFMLANELTDGNIDTMYKLNNFVQNKLGTFTKAFYDSQPEIPSIMVRTKMSILFNSALSAFSTPIKALVGNVGGLIGKPTSVFVGALSDGNVNVLRRSFSQYASLTDAMTKASEHMKIVYRKAAKDPTKVSYIMRDDIALREVAELDVLRNYADAASLKGEEGPNILLSIWEEQHELAKHPWLRFGANSMTGLDGFNRSMNATAEAKGRAFNAIIESGEEITEESLQKASDTIYKNFFDENGMITDEAVDYSTREAALNLESMLAKGLSEVVRRFPIVRSIFMFPTTQANRLDVFRKWSPLDAIHIGQRFEGDLGAFRRPFDQTPNEDVVRVLRARGIDPTQNPRIEYETKRAEYKGRVIIGTSTISTAAFLTLNGRVRGNGHWDPQVQRTRRELGWQKKTIQMWDGKWYSYEFLGPLGDLIAASSDLIDNFDSISTSTREGMHYKLGFMLGASLIEPSFLAQLEPIQDIFTGNPAAINKWIANFSNMWLPFAGQRQELSRLMAPMKREYEQDVGDLLRNKNNFVDTIDPESKLPYKYNFITGKTIGHVENMWGRLNNAYNPIKVHENQTEVEQFLIDIEYDSKPFFNRSPGGVEYTIHQRAALYSRVGENGVFATELKKIIGRAQRLTYTDDQGKTYRGFRNIMKHIRRGNISNEILDYKKFAMIIQDINRSLSRASRIAQQDLKGTELFINLDMQEGLIKEGAIKTKRGDLKGVLSLEDEYKQFQEQLKSR